MKSYLGRTTTWHSFRCLGMIWGRYLHRDLSCLHAPNTTDTWQNNTSALRSINIDGADEAEIEREVEDLLALITSTMMTTAMIFNCHPTFKAYLVESMLPVRPYHEKDSKETFSMWPIPKETHTAVMWTEGLCSSRSLPT
jgi:hypothetical protein